MHLARPVIGLPEVLRLYVLDPRVRMAGIKLLTTSNSIIDDIGNDL